MTAPLQPMSFEDWKRLHPEMIGTIDCEDCDGQGDYSCECECGHLHRAECKRCGGSGELYLAREEYDRQLQRDLAALRALGLAAANAADADRTASTSSSEGRNEGAAGGS